MNNDRAEKMVYAYVNSEYTKRVREHQRDLALAESKGTSLFGLPKLHFDKAHQDPDVHESLAHNKLTSIGLDVFVANDNVHELHDVMEGLLVLEHGDGSASMRVVPSEFENSPSSSHSSPAEESEEGNAY